MLKEVLGERKQIVLNFRHQHCISRYRAFLRKHSCAQVSLKTTGVCIESGVCTPDVLHFHASLHFSISPNDAYG